MAGNDHEHPISAFHGRPLQRAAAADSDLLGKLARLGIQDSEQLEQIPAGLNRGDSQVSMGERVWRH
jgi:hypothetical protein